MELYKPLIDQTIATIINQFHRKPHNFFNEHEFHQYCYHVFYGKKEFSKPTFSFTAHCAGSGSKRKRRTK